MRRPRVAIVVLGLLIAAPAGAFEWPWTKHEPAPMPPRPVVTEIVAPTDLRVRSVPGVIAAKTQVTLGFQTLGRLVERNVDLGDRVQAGQVIARLDPEDLTSNVRAAQASRDAAKVQLETAQSTAQRVRALARRNVASTAQLEQAEQTLASAEATLEQAESELLRAQDAAGFADLSAPFAGVISAVFETPGAVVQAGAPVLQLSAENEAEAVIDLPDSSLQDVRVGSAFVVWQENAEEQASPARIDRIEPVSNAATRSRRVHLRLEQPQGFRLGALIRAQPAQQEDSVVLTLPPPAILMVDGTPHVWRVTRSETGAEVVRVAVETDALVDGRICILSGIAPGDEIVIRGVHALEPGQPVGRRMAP